MKLADELPVGNLSSVSNDRSGQSLLISEHSSKRHPSDESVSLIQLPSGSLPLTGLEEGSGGRTVS